MEKRVLSAAIALPILTAAVWIGDIWYTLVVFTACVLGAIEYHKISPSANNVSLGILSIIGVALFLFNVQVEGKYSDVILTAVIIVSLAGLIFINGSKILDLSVQIDRYVSSLWLLGGILYLGWLGSHFLLLRGLEMGKEWTILAMYSTFATDTGAFLVGTWIGRHRMVPSISPGKTWEGAVGGLIGSLVAAPLLATFLGLNLPIVYSLVAGAIIALAGSVGDLVESMMKRSAEVKDAGFLVPGHGGLLDRLDSLIFVAPVIYYYAKWLTII